MLRPCGQGRQPGSSQRLSSAAGALTSSSSSKRGELVETLFGIVSIIGRRTDGAGQAGGGQLFCGAAGALAQRLQTQNPHSVPLRLEPLLQFCVQRHLLRILQVFVFVWMYV